ncbi:hypothetical protein IYO1511_c20690 [Lactiplantibacillus plantarum]|nr:hypothetical protein IYO1511_c20690 [Lactiplantibacillus plantarum]
MKKGNSRIISSCGNGNFVSRLWEVIVNKDNNHYCRGFFSATRTNLEARAARIEKGRR